MESSSSATLPRSCSCDGEPEPSRQPLRRGAHDTLAVVATDEELLEAWRAGDTKAGNELFGRHFRAIERFFANKASSDVEELVQSTFVRCVEARDRFAGLSSFRTYVLGIARNVVREYYRRAGRSTVDVEELSVIDMGAGPSTIRARREADRLLYDALRALPLAQQTVLELYYWEDLTAKEIGEVLGIPEPTVRSRLFRAKEALDKLLGHSADADPSAARPRASIDEEEMDRSDEPAHS